MKYGDVVLKKVKMLKITRVAEEKHQQILFFGTRLFITRKNMFVSVKNSHNLELHILEFCVYRSN